MNPKLQWDLQSRVQATPGVELRKVASEWEKVIGEDNIETELYKVDVRDNYEELRRENIRLQEELNKITLERDLLLLEKTRQRYNHPSLPLFNHPSIPQPYRAQQNWNPHNP